MNKRIKTKSGLDGWQDRLQSQYASFDEFMGYCATYGLDARLGYSNVRKAWNDNPLIQGSTNPDDLCRVFDLDDLPVRLSVVVELIVDADDPSPEWELRKSAEQAVENGLKKSEDIGFNHDHDGDMAITVLGVTTAGNDLESYR